MRVKNLIFFLLTFLLPLPISLFLTSKIVFFPLTYSIVLGMWIGIFKFFNFVRYRLKAGKYKKKMFSPYKNYRIAAVIATYNEDPDIVKGTAVSVLSALKGRGDVFILDDSNNEEIIRKIDELKKYGIKIFRRGSRRGFKAGAINDFLKEFGKNYDLLAIFDADQRPLPSYFDEMLPYFSDKKVAFVQSPQVYTEITSGVSEAAFWQQQPFSRVIMRGRTPFSLGSGTIFRIDVLFEVGGLDENTITEDVSTSVDIHSKGYKSVYVDKELLWFGIPPPDLRAYLSQQSRWAFGSFQIIEKLLKSDLDFSVFIDYFNGWIYWLKIGPIAFAEMVAPIVFLLFSIKFMIIDPVLYIIIYFPFFISTLSTFLTGMRDVNYGVRSFFYHQSIQILEFTVVTTAFISWILRKKRPFNVTPKKAGEFPLRLLLPQLTMLVLLVISILKGIPEFLSTYDYNLKLTLLINIMWAAYFVPFFVFGIYIVRRYYEPEEKTEFIAFSIKKIPKPVEQDFSTVQTADYENAHHGDLESRELYGITYQNILLMEYKYFKDKSFKLN